MLGIFSYLYLFLYRVLQNMQKFIVNYSHLTVCWNLSLCSVSVKHYSTYLFPETLTNPIQYPTFRITLLQEEKPVVIFVHLFISL